MGECADEGERKGERRQKTGGRPPKAPGGEREEGMRDSGWIGIFDRDYLLVINRYPLY